MRPLLLLASMISLPVGCATFDRRSPVDFIAQRTPGRSRVKIPWTPPRVGDLRTVKTCYTHGSKPWQCVVILERVAVVRDGQERALCIRVIRSDFTRYRSDVGVNRFVRRVGQTGLDVHTAAGTRVQGYSFGSLYASLGHDTWPYRTLPGLKLDAGHFSGLRTIQGVPHAIFRFHRSRTVRHDYRTTEGIKEQGRVLVRLTDGRVTSAASSTDTLVLGEHSSSTAARYALTIRPLTTLPAALGPAPRCQLP